MSTVGCGIVVGRLSGGTENPDILYGDVNANGIVDIADTVLLARYIAQDPAIKITKQGLQNAKKLVRNTGRALLHTKRDIACAAHGAQTVKEFQSEEEARCPISQKQEEKDFTHSQGISALAVTIL
mgnify:CR=1 FL=1